MIMQHLAQFQSQTRRLLPRNMAILDTRLHIDRVSIADATLASSQRWLAMRLGRQFSCFNRRRDACFLATAHNTCAGRHGDWFQSQTRRLLPRNFSTASYISRTRSFQSQTRRLLPRNVELFGIGEQPTGFQSQTRRLLPRNKGNNLNHSYTPLAFQSQTRRLLPRNVTKYAFWGETVAFQSQTRRLLPRNFLRKDWKTGKSYRFNRRRDACFLATRQPRG